MSSVLHGIQAGPPGTVYGPGIDGLRVVRRLADCGRAYLAARCALVMQVGALFQWRILEPELKSLGFSLGDVPARRDRGAILGRAVWSGSTS